MALYRDLDEIAEQTRRSCAAHMDELRAVKQQIAAQHRASEQWHAERLNQVVDEYLDEQARQAAAADQASGVQAEPEAVQTPGRWPAEQSDSENVLRQQREAVARSAAARQRQQVVTPIDDDGDDESEYYRRKSWLI